MKSNGQTSENSRDSGVLSNPLSFVHSGIFVWEDTNLYGRGGEGYYWLLYSSSTTLSNRLSFYNTSLDPQYSNAHGYGFAARCVASGGLAPDSICPKGWQLPTYSGDKSLTNLINTSYSMKNTSGENSRDSGVLSAPLSFLRSGVFGWDNANLGNRSIIGNFWSKYSANTTNSIRLRFDNTDLSPRDSTNRGNGFTVRCVSVYGIDRTIAYFRRNPFRENKVLV